METLCGMTKCRADENVKTGFESCYLFQALTKLMSPERFFEIGFGRGTTSYLMARNGCQVETHDIVGLTQRRKTWFRYKDVEMSNYNFLMHCAEEFGDVRTQITYRHCDTSLMKPEQKPDVDIVYIDGSHDYGPVLHDFQLALTRTRENSVIILDDYHPNYGAKVAIDEILKKYDGILVEVNGHIYGPEAEKGSGHIIIPFGDYKALL
jgi:predicted O-methyltransferase YrrM